MQTKHLAIEIIRQLARNIVNDGFVDWHSRYYNYHGSYSWEDMYSEALHQRDRLEECLGEEEAKKLFQKLFDEAEESYRATVDPQVWELYKNQAQRTVSDRPVVGIADDDVPF